MKKSRFSEVQIMNILKEAQNGGTVADICRRHGISDARRKSASQKDVCRSPSSKGNPSGSSAKKVVKPSHRREMAHAAKKRHGISVSLACKTFSMSEVCFRYERRLVDDNQ